MKMELAKLQTQLADLTNQLNQIKAGQDRLRLNLNTVGKDSELGRRYLKKLSDEETDIEKLDGQISELRKQVEEQQKKLADYLKDLKVE